MSKLLQIVSQTPEYAAVKELYADSKAKRSQVPLINHIDEGIRIIDYFGGILPNGIQFDPHSAALAYCIHPLFQNDDGIAKLRQSIGDYLRF